jgi:hypothetical protein
MLYSKLQYGSDVSMPEKPKDAVVMDVATVSTINVSTVRVALVAPARGPDERLCTVQINRLHIHFI